MKKLSIILPTYNIEKYISESLESVTKQSYSNLEIIVVDDNSKDDTVKIVQSYAKLDPRIRIIQNKINIGPGPSRNLGIENSTGYYLTFMDHDDWQDLDRYKKMILQMEIDKTDACFSYANDYYEREESFTDTGYPKYETGLLNLKKERGNFFYKFFPPWAKIYKNSLIKDNGIEFAKNGVKFDDILFHSLLIFNLDKISILNETLYFHRVFDGSITDKYFEDKKFMNKEFIETMKQALKINPSRKIFGYFTDMINFDLLSKKEKVGLATKYTSYFLFSSKKLRKLF